MLEGNALCLAVAHKGDVVSIGFESGKVEKNTLPDFDFDDFTARYDRLDLPAGTASL